MAEKWELVDINKNKTGVIHERGQEDSIHEGMYHLVVDVWTKNSKGEILLTQRHPDKNYGLMWECSGGSIVLGEDSVAGAIRELFEETGIVAQKENLLFLGDTIKSNYIVDTWLYVLEDDNIPLNLQAEEVVDAMWLPADEMESKKDIICDGVWKRYCQFREKILHIKK